LKKYERFFESWISGVRYFLARGNKEKETRAGKIFIYGLAVLFVLGFIFAIFNPLVASSPLG
jgi:Sec-independent protein secretion pathway component TatC